MLLLGEDDATPSDCDCDGDRDCDRDGRDDRAAAVAAMAAAVAAAVARPRRPKRPRGHERPPPRVRATSEPIEVLHPQHTAGAWVAHTSASAAARAYAKLCKLQASGLRCVAHGEYAHSGGWLARADRTRGEPQDDLPADEPSGSPAEEWRLHPRGEGRICVSNRARVQTKHARGDGWGQVRRPVGHKKGTSAYVHVGGRRTRMRDAVWETFRGPVPRGVCVGYVRASQPPNDALHNLRLETTA